MEFDYFYGPEDAEQYQFYRIPKLLITSEQFKDVSVESKLLYGLMLDRLSLSIKNGWFDSLNRAYIIYTIEDVTEDMHCGSQKAVKLVAELEKNAGLIKKMSEQNRNYEQIEEITLHFGKGTVEPFTAKDGREMLKIMIPNADRSDHTPWASFVLPAKAVHENQYGKGLWAKIPADGHTTLTKPYLAGQGEDGKNIWKDEKTTVSNRELKSMVEFYKKDLVPKYDIPEL